MNWMQTILVLVCSWLAFLTVFFLYNAKRHKRFRIRMDLVLKNFTDRAKTGLAPSTRLSFGLAARILEVAIEKEK